MPDSHNGPAALERVAETAGRLEAELGKAIIGQQRVILIVFVAGGHCLLRGAPGDRSQRVVRADQPRPNVAWDLDAYQRHTGTPSSVGAIERPIVPRRVHPMRSAWSMVPFAALLSVEWTLRRRQVQR